MRHRPIPRMFLPISFIGLGLAGCVQDPPIPLARTYPTTPMAAAPLPSPRPPETVTVQPGDGLLALARRIDVPSRAIIEANGLKPPYGLRIGQVLRVPRVTGHVVQPGESLRSIAQASGVETGRLAELNHLNPPYTIRRGNELIVPLTSSGQSPVQTAQAPTPYPPAFPAPPSTPVAISPLPTDPVAPPPPAPIPPPSGRSAFPTSPLPPAGGVVQAEPVPASAPNPSGVAGVALPPLPGSTSSTGPLASAPPYGVAAGAAVPGGSNAVSAPTPLAPPPKPLAAAAPGAVQLPPASVATAEPAPPPKSSKTFLWPVRGKVISSFGGSGEGDHNDGINIAAAKDTPILAAEGGTVAYVGNELRSFGNLMLIKHPDGWYTAYAHADGFLVKKGDEVRRGQPIGRVGNTGSASEPQLHFEIRRGEKPVDPSSFLPQLNS